MGNSKRKRARRDAKHQAGRAKAAPKGNVGGKHDSKAQAKAPGAAAPRPKIPFGYHDRILLVGEGDFSFAHSLAMHHGCADVVATSFDPREDVLKKYPHADSTMTDLAALTPPVPLHHSIDATKLNSYKELRKHAPYTYIVFNFPHTGGLSTDVNRQVRHNQALLVSFFSACLCLLSHEDATDRQSASFHNSHASLKSAKSAPPSLSSEDAPPGRIIVTLFEGTPYSLWNIRDLARHAGLCVLESWRFNWADYPGYTHQRTLGVVEADSAWKGKDREARMYVFEKSNAGGEERRESDGRPHGTKRKKGADTSDDDD